MSNETETALPREWKVEDIPRNIDRLALEDAMTLPTIEEARSWRGLMLVATGDEPVGRIDAVYVDRTTRQPEWVLVHTGLFGSSRTFVPLTDATKLGDTVRVPHDPGVVREAPRLEPDVDLSESDEARLYAHYGIDYTTAVSPSGLPATESGTDATTELHRPIAAVPSTATPRLEADAVAWPERRAGGRRRPLLAGLGALALAALGSGLALLRARRRRPPSLGERLAKAGRGAADTLTSTAGSIIREAAAGAASDRARQAAGGGRRAARRAAAQAAASGAAAAAGGRWAARRAGGAGRQAASEGRRFARRAGREATEAAAGTRATVAAAGTKATVAAKRAGRRRARARKRAAAAAAGTARSLTGFPTAAGRRMQRLDLDQRGRKVREQARKAVPRRRRRSNMKVIGKLGMALGAAVGYVLGAKAGRERYEQIAASARQLMEKPQVKRVMESAPGNLGARVEQVANKAADAVHQASDRVAPSDTAAKTATVDGPGGTTNAGASKRPAAGSGSRERSKSD
jgi:hypothetical protein